MTGLGHRLRRLLHWHRDPNWQQRGIYGYEQCRCGARRTTLVALNLRGPHADDWPPCTDEHGRAQITSGWQCGDWSTSGYPAGRTVDPFRAERRAQVPAAHCPYCGGTQAALLTVGGYGCADCRFPLIPVCSPQCRWPGFHRDPAKEGRA